MATRAKGITIDTSGMRDINRMLKKLPRTIQGQVINKALRQGFTKFVKPIAKSGVPVQTGDLKRSIGTESAKKTRKNWFGIWMGARNKKGKYEGWRAHFVEYGTVTQPAKPFMSPAFNQGVPKIIDNFSKLLANNMYKFMQSKIKAANKKRKT